MKARIAASPMPEEPPTKTATGLVTCFAVKAALAARMAEIFIMLEL